MTTFSASHPLKANYFLLALIILFGAKVWGQKPPAEWTWVDDHCKQRTLADLERILAENKRYQLNNQGTPADFHNAILRNAPLGNIFIGRVNFKGADLTGADLHKSNLIRADFDGATLTGANLTGTILSYANLKGTHLSSKSVPRLFGCGGLIHGKPTLNKELLAVLAAAMQTSRIQPAPARLIGAMLDNAILVQADLESADLTGADLDSADLTDADLSSATVEDTTFKSALLVRTKLMKSNLTRADFSLANLTSAQLPKAVLPYALFTSARLEDANLEYANASFVDFTSAAMSKVHMRWANLLGSTLTAAELAGADLRKSNLEDSIFEPRTLPDASSLALADGFSELEYKSSPAALYTLRKQLQDTGLKDQERDVTYSIMHVDAQIHRSECHLRTLFHDCLVYQFNTIFFDWTSLYGRRPGRPLLILIGLGCIMAILYFASMHFGHHSGIWLVKRGDSRTRKIRIRPPMSEIGEPRWKIFRTRLRSEWRMARAAMFFSLKTAFNIGYQEFNLGQWMSMLTNREYDLKAVGWVRTVAGFQSLISLYLLALWLLTYFGHPFAQ